MSTWLITRYNVQGVSSYMHGNALVFLAIIGLCLEKEVCWSVMGCFHSGVQKPLKVSGKEDDWQGTVVTGQIT